MGIGIAVGYATLGQIGFTERREYTCIGSVINHASRLCDEAKAGQIVVSQRVLTAVEDSVEAGASVVLAEVRAVAEVRAEGGSAILVAIVL